VLFIKQKNEFSRMVLYSSYFNRPGDEEPNPGLKSPPSTRPMSALPLVTIFRGQGLEQVIEGLQSPLDAIRNLADTLNSQPDVEVLHQPDTGILCFRMTPEGISNKDLDALQQNLYQQIMSSGERSVSITKVDGVASLRLVVVSPHTTNDDLYETIIVLRKLILKQE
jgi:L-2,4-diaminobutyrate decarboxylase